MRPSPFPSGCFINPPFPSGLKVVKNRFDIPCFVGQGSQADRAGGFLISCCSFFHHNVGCCHRPHLQCPTGSAAAAGRVSARCSKALSHCPPTVPSQPLSQGRACSGSPSQCCWVTPCYTHCIRCLLFRLEVPGRPCGNLLLG